MRHLKIKINKLEFIEDTVLKDIDFVVNENDKICIVWNNWAWKTTLMKAIIWEIKKFDGFIENVWNLTIWYLTQIYSDNEEKLVKDELKEWFLEIIRKEKELKTLEENMKENPENMDLINDYTILLEQFSIIWGYDYWNRIHQVSSWIWIIDLLEKRLIEVSWWERTKIALAKILLESPDILFLDEPTNFIDMWSVEWLESYLQNKWSWGYVIISHDREFLDKTCKKTYEVQPWRWITYYHQNYTGYVEQRGKVESKKISEYWRQEEYLLKQKTLINRFRAGSRAGWAKSREKMIDKMDKVDKPYIPRKPKFFFEYSWESGNKVLHFREAFVGRKEPLFFIQEAILYQNQRVWIIWENWTWKSTLLKTVMREIELLDWFLTRWKSLNIVYYSQMHEWLHKDLSVKENFEKHWLYSTDQHLIWYLSHFLFEKDDIWKKVSDLSGWQKSKLLFALLWQKECNLLIMDEPTNHLDYDTKEQLESVLSSFKWTILFISHDRYFVNKLATHIWFVEGWELSISTWTYSDYKYKQERWLDFDMSLFDEEANLDIVLEDKLWERQAKKMKNKFWNSKNKESRKVNNKKSK